MTHKLMTLAVIFAVGCAGFNVADADDDLDAGADDEAAQDSTGGGSSSSNDDSTGATPGGEAPAYIATMTHLEGGWSYDGPNGDEKFERDLIKIRAGMDIFNAAGGIMTVESEIPFSTKAIAVDSPIFTELLDAGFGVGTHCDITTTLNVSVTEMAAEFAKRKTPLDTLIGAENNLGCSGGASMSDWVLAADEAGFKYINGIVGFHYLSMDESARPPGWTNDYIIKEGHYHDPAPVELSARVHPFAMADATDFEPDPDGVIVANAGELGNLAFFAEKDAGEECAGSCALTSEDIDVALQHIDDGLAQRDPERVFKVDVYLPLMLFTDENSALVTSFIEQVNSQFVDTGRLEWGTQRQVYESFIAYNQ